MKGEMKMKYLFATTAVLAMISTASALPVAKQNYTPRPDVHRATCYTNCYTNRSTGQTTCTQNCTNGF
jgi:hypothetical protein